MRRAFAAALVVGALFCSSAAFAQTPPIVDLQTGFQPDPHVANVFAGGAVDARTLGGECRGFIAVEPTYVVDYTASHLPLSISANSSADTTLVVRTPTGAYFCNDDGDTGLNPSLTIPEPVSGQYQIWVGVYGGGSAAGASLSIAELYSAGPGPSPAPPEEITPTFPRWPPPRASARAEISRTTFGAAATLGDVADRLMSALRGAGNSRASFYRAPGGFVIVARLERIRTDARPESQGRFIEPRPGQIARSDDPLDFIEALFFAPEGHYRQVMFVVSDQAFGESNWTLTSEAAGDLLNAGSALLQDDYRALPFSANQRVTALIYEFRKQGGAQAQVRVPGRWNASTHLTRSGLRAGLSN